MEENNYNNSNDGKELSQHSENLIISSDIRIALLEIANWGKFLSILGFIGAAIMILCGLIMTVFSSVASSMVMKIPFIGSFLGVIYILFGLVYYFPAKYLYDFSAYCKQALLLNEQESLNYAFLRLKSHYKFIGIMVVILLCLYVLIFLFAIGAGMLARGI